MRILFLIKHKHTIGSLKNFGGKPVYEVVLTATDKKRDLSRIVLYVSKDTYQPLFIMMEQRDKSRSEITVTGYQTGLPPKFFNDPIL